MSNVDFSLRIAQQLAALGVREVCLCAGARNSPLVVVFDGISEFRKFHFFEERSAAFFALGRIKSHGAPVAVITTSGTAAAELLPAVIEAHYTGLPLICVTADRPREYRGTGAPQAIEQVRLFGSYAKLSFDIEAGDAIDLSDWARCDPLHLNVCLDEPLIDRSFSGIEFRSTEKADRVAREVGSFEKERAQLDAFLDEVKNPVVIVGALDQAARAAVGAFLSNLNAPVYCEAGSGLREDPRLEPIQLRSTDRVLDFMDHMKQPLDGVLRIGGVPTLRFWRAIEGKRSHLPVLSMSDLPFSGSTRSRLLQAPLAEFLSRYRVRTPVKTEQYHDLKERDRKLENDILECLEREPASEPGMIHAFSKRISKNARVYLGNSMPIREWDLAASRSGAWKIAANRGANGIDGQVSTFLGWSEPGQENWCVIGDLTALYDLPAPWILAQCPGLNVRIVVINNGGGKIFSRIFGNAVFENRHETDFAPWAALWKLRYERWERIPAGVAGQPAGAGNCLIELRPDNEASARFWSAYDRLCLD